jgi:hypothetical protein
MKPPTPASAAALRAQGRPYEPCGYGRTPALDRLEINLGYAALALARGDEPARAAPARA